MASKATHASLWLPGFEIDAPAYPDLFSSNDEAAAPAADLSADSGESATADTAGDLPRPWRPATAQATQHTADNPAITWPQWTDSALDGLEGQATKFNANIEAIAVLRAIEREGRSPTPDERVALLRFTGWGGIPASFNLDGTDAAWKQRARQLSELLQPGEYESARASVNNSHYTEPFIVRWIWAALRRLGFEGGRILDPSSGIGHFLGCMPADIATRSRITAVELDDLAGRILRALYGPWAWTSASRASEAATLADGSFDLVVSNVPFGNYQVSDGRNRPYSRFSIHNWFVGKALDLVRPGGLVCLITSAWFLDQRDESARAHAASQADLVSAIRLPQGAFMRLASTDVQSDIVMLRRSQPGEAGERGVGRPRLRARRVARSALPGQVHAVQRLVRGQPAQRARPHRQGDPWLHAGAHCRPRRRPGRSAAAGRRPDPQRRLCAAAGGFSSTERSGDHGRRTRRRTPGQPRAARRAHPHRTAGRTRRRPRQDERHRAPAHRRHVRHP